MLLEEAVACTKVSTPSTMTNEAAAGDTRHDVSTEKRLQTRRKAPKHNDDDVPGRERRNQHELTRWRAVANNNQRPRRVERTASVPRQKKEKLRIGSTWGQVDASASPTAAMNVTARGEKERVVSRPRVALAVK
jgi:hypothetical protein